VNINMRSLWVVEEYDCLGGWQAIDAYYTRDEARAKAKNRMAETRVRKYVPEKKAS